MTKTLASPTLISLLLQIRYQQDPSYLISDLLIAKYIRHTTAAIAE